MNVWHEQESFWQKMAPKLFSRKLLERTEDEVDSLVDLAALQHSDSILDLCCGPGRHTLELARRGYKVTGVDRTEEYLAEARRQADAESLNIDLVRADMREYRENETFSVVLNLYTSFGYFKDPSDDEKVIDNIFTSMRPGGKLVMELMGKEVLAGISRTRDWHEDNGVIYLEEWKIFDDWRWVEARWIKLEGETMEEFTVSHRLYSARELADLLRKTGFQDVKAYGSLHGIPYDHKAERLVLAARKPESA